ncbi:MAG TPA: hypothetical protein VFS16_13855 [Acidimicrobiia bacterium]|nr:hypothetical protein [Acidimicrobiia bacterium]
MQWPEDGPSADDAQGTDGPWPGAGGSAGPDQGGAGGDPASPQEIRRRLSAGADGSTRRERRDRSAGSGGGGTVPESTGGDPVAGEGFGGGTSDTTLLDSLMLHGSDDPEEAVPPQVLPGEIDVASPATENTANRRNGPALWATALSFASLLLISVGWVWAHRRLYDPA